MAMIANDFKDLLTIKIKSRDDNVFDQYSRIFMVKVLMITSMITGISWYGDKFNCILPKSMSVSDDFGTFVGSTCWIQGVYVYRSLRDRNDEAAYYGVTRDIEFDGLYKDELCKTYERNRKGMLIRNEECKPLKKTFFQQYQYMPFLIGAIAVLYYLPYMLHKLANHDIVRLKRQTDREEPDPEAIYKVFFKNRKGKPVNQSPVVSRQILILLVKVFYLIVNIGAFVILDNILNGYFAGLGTKWFQWTSLNNTAQYDYTGGRDTPRPANEMLPPFGYCEFYTSAKDIKEHHVNQQKLVCELSQHVLYQYTLVLLWILIIVGIVVAIVGLLYGIFRLVQGCLGMRTLGNYPQTQKIQKRLTPRQMDYFEFLKVQNIALYGEVLALFTEDVTQESRSDASTPQPNSWDKSPAMNGGRKNGNDMELTQRPGFVL